MILQVFENHLILKKIDLLWNFRISFSVYDFSFVNCLQRKNRKR